MDARRYASWLIIRYKFFEFPRCRRFSRRARPTTNTTLARPSEPPENGYFSLCVCLSLWLFPNYRQCIGHEPNMNLMGAPLWRHVSGASFGHTIEIDFVDRYCRRLRRYFVSANAILLATSMAGPHLRQYTTQEIDDSARERESLSAGLNDTGGLHRWPQWISATGEEPAG